MKSYTDLEQSKVLAKFLPIESTDCYWEDDMSVEFGHGWHSQHIPCWSLAALLELIRNFQPNNQSALFVSKEDGYQYMSYGSWATDEHSNPIDVCYMMILKLHELNLL